MFGILTHKSFTDFFHWHPFNFSLIRWNKDSSKNRDSFACKKVREKNLPAIFKFNELSLVFSRDDSNWEVSNELEMFWVKIEVVKSIMRMDEKLFLIDKFSELLLKIFEIDWEFMLKIGLLIKSPKNVPRFRAKMFCEHL